MKFTAWRIAKKASLECTFNRNRILPTRKVLFSNYYWLSCCSSTCFYYLYFLFCSLSKFCYFSCFSCSWSCYCLLSCANNFSHFLFYLCSSTWSCFCSSYCSSFISDTLFWNIQLFPVCAFLHVFIHHIMFFFLFKKMILLFPF